MYYELWNVGGNSRLFSKLKTQKPIYEIQILKFRFLRRTWFLVTNYFFLYFNKKKPSTLVYCNIVIFLGVRFNLCLEMCRLIVKLRTQSFKFVIGDMYLCLLVFVSCFALFYANERHKHNRKKSPRLSIHGRG